MGFLNAFSDERIKSHILDSFSERLPFAMWARSMTGQPSSRVYLWVGGAFVETFGFTEDELIGKTPYQVFNQSVALSYDASDQLAFDGIYHQRVINSQIKGGGSLPVTVDKYPLTRHGKLIGVVGYAFPKHQKLEDTFKPK